MQDKKIKMCTLCAKPLRITFAKQLSCPNWFLNNGNEQKSFMFNQQIIFKMHKKQDNPKRRRT